MGARHPPQRRPIDITCHHLETIYATREDDQGDQPNHGELDNLWLSNYEYDDDDDDEERITIEPPPWPSG